MLLNTHKILLDYLYLEKNQILYFSSKVPAQHLTNVYQVSKKGHKNTIDEETHE